MNSRYVIFFRNCITLLLFKLTIIDCNPRETLEQDIVERLYHYNDSEFGNVKIKGNQLLTEFLIIGRKVSWIEAKSLCPLYSAVATEMSQKTKECSQTTPVLNKDNGIYNSSLATLLTENIGNWLSRMLSESNYRYDGLWIGGRRTNNFSEWTWVDDQLFHDVSNPINSSLLENYPGWYEPDEKAASIRNCLLFDRIGHDIPIFIPENCDFRRSFICMRYVEKVPKYTITEENSLSINGYRYTLYRVNGNENKFENDWIKEADGGGITWNDAKQECEIRGQNLAMIFTTSVASALANMMLKSRPTMENAWLGGWSLDGAEWIWLPSGFKIPSMKSPYTQYPPWLDGHPVIVSTQNQHSNKLGRCLILDRHLCPERIAPVFLDLDCDRRRPFICQNDLTGINRQPQRNSRKSNVDDIIIEFSEEEMTYEQAEKHCEDRDGQIAAITNSRLLSACLDKMSELSINHVWTNGRTVEINNNWQWVNSNNENVFSEDILSKAPLCFGKRNRSMPENEPNVCLNLDYVARGFPLFYGLPCNETQIVLCSKKHRSIEEIIEVRLDDIDTRFSKNSELKTQLGKTKDYNSSSHSLNISGHDTTLSSITD